MFLSGLMRFTVQLYKHINLGNLRIKIETVVFESHFWPHKDNSWPVLGISVWNQTNSWLRVAGMTRSCSAAAQARDKDGDPPIWPT